MTARMTTAEIEAKVTDFAKSEGYLCQTDVLKDVLREIIGEGEVMFGGTWFGYPSGTATPQTIVIAHTSLLQLADLWAGGINDDVLGLYVSKISPATYPLFAEYIDTIPSGEQRRVYSFIRGDNFEERVARCQME